MTNCNTNRKKRLANIGEFAVEHKVLEHLSDITLSSSQLFSSFLSSTTIYHEEFHPDALPIHILQRFSLT